MPKNTDESFFKYFIEHLVGVRKSFKFKYKQDRLRPKQDQLTISSSNHNQGSEL